MPDVDWHPWHTAAFLDAQRRRRPVLLLLETAWSPACARVRADVLSHHEVVQAVADTMVAVRVDADRRPDIADRYGLGHWPSLLILTPDGHILTGGTHPDASLAARIRAVADSFARTPHARETAPALIDEILPIDDVALTARLWLSIKIPANSNENKRITTERSRISSFIGCNGFMSSGAVNLLLSFRETIGVGQLQFCFSVCRLSQRGKINDTDARLIRFTGLEM